MKADRPVKVKFFVCIFLSLIFSSFVIIPVLGGIYPSSEDFIYLLIPAVLLVLGWYYFGRRAYPRLLGGFLTFQDRKSPKTWRDKAYKEIGRKDASPSLTIKYFDKALALDPTDSDAWNSRGICFSSIGRLDEAKACFLNALKFGSNHSNRHIYQDNCDLVTELANSQPKPKATLRHKTTSQFITGRGIVKTTAVLVGILAWLWLMFGPLILYNPQISDNFREGALTIVFGVGVTLIGWLIIDIMPKIGMEPSSDPGNVNSPDIAALTVGFLFISYGVYVWTRKWIALFLSSVFHYHTYDRGLMIVIAMVLVGAIESIAIYTYVLTVGWWRRR